MVAAKQFGSIATIQATHYRSARYGSWARMPLAECDAQHIDWAAFEGEAEHHDFDPQRYLNWRFYWDYSGFNCFENMVHQVGFWYKVLDLDIPQSATMSGGNFHSPKMEGPDTIAVSLIQAEKLLFSWTSMFGNGYLGEGGEYLLGTGGTLRRDPSDRITYIPHGKKMEGEVAPPRNTDHTDVNIAHVQNFFDCVRSRKEPNCPFELGLRSAVAGQMAIASYRQQRMVRWDAHAQEIV
jgi:predicted dehydrogenase